MAKSLWFYIVLTLSANALAAEAPATTQTTASANDIEKVIDTLEDPASREALIRDLQILMEAQAESAPVQEESVALWPWIRDSVLEIWNTMANVEPRQVAISLAVSLAVLAGAIVARWLVLRVLVRLYTRLARPGSEIALPTALTRSITAILVVVSILLIANSWGADLSAMMATDFGSRLVQMLLSIGLIVALTMAVWHAVDIMIDRGLRSHMSGSGHERRLRRTDTLIPLVTTTVRIIIGMLSVLLILSEIGLNIGPLLAGAGILGLAIGFGAQTLVKDLIGGVTILLEDAASLGDVVETGGHIGTVEEMRIRVLQLRDLAGIVHVIPYSEVATIKNYTKDYSYYVFDVGVAYREDTDEVVKALTDLGKEFCEDEDYKDRVLEPLEILGVDEFADSAVIIKARIKTIPRERWTVGREFNRRIKQRFDELGIEIPFPHTTLYIGEPKKGQAPAMPLTLAEKEEKLLEKWAGGENG